MAGETNSPPRRLSASAALQVLRNNPALLFDEGEEKHEMLPIVKVTSRRRFSLRDSTGSNTSIQKKDILGSSSNDDTTTTKKSSLLNDASSTTATTMSMSDPNHNANNTNTDAPPAQQQPAGRRRSSRKSVNGLVIEFDLDDESECTMFEHCDDYQDDWRPSLERQDSNHSLEELRTRLEALEHEKQTQQLPEHDDHGLGQECMKKCYWEALESSNRDASSVGTSVRSLRGIPEHSRVVDNKTSAAEKKDVNQEDDNGDDEADDEESVHSGQSPWQQQRRSTIRSSIHGSVLEYDWTSGSESEVEDEHEHEHQDAGNKDDEQEEERC